MEASQFLKQIKDDGWYLGDTDGPCRQYVHRQRSGVITLCVRYTDLLGAETVRTARAVAGSEGAASGNGATGDEASAPEVVVEETSTGASAYAPALPGCLATGRDAAEARDRFADAAALHRKALAGEAG